MALLLEGIGEDWVVTRRPGGKPELVTFRSLDELRRLVIRAMAKADQAEAPKRPAVILPQAVPAPAPPPPMPPPLPGVAKSKYPPLPYDADCQSCGACCAPQDQRKDTHPALEPEDVAQIPKIMRKGLVVNDGGHHYIGTKKNQEGVVVCSAFSGSIGGRNKCGIYSKRPMVCRIFEKGSDECLAARAAFGV